MAFNSKVNPFPSIGAAYFQLVVRFNHANRFACDHYHDNRNG